MLATLRLSLSSNLGVFYLQKKSSQGLRNKKMAGAISVSSPKPSILQSPVSVKDPNSNFLGGYSSFNSVCLQLKARSKKRREILSLVVASANTAIDSNKGGRFYLNFTGFPFPLGPFLNRRTIRTEVSFFTVFLVLLDFNDFSIFSWITFSLNCEENRWKFDCCV